MTPSQVATRTLLELASFHEYKENLKKRAEETSKNVEWYKEKLDTSKA